MHPPDPDIVNRAVHGDPLAVSELLEQIRPVILRYSTARLGRDNVAEDITQEVCLALLRALPDYTDRGRPFIAFVYSIAARKIADVGRAAARDRTDRLAKIPDLPDPAPGPEYQAVAADNAARLEQLLAHLPPTQREILTLRVAIGMTAEEVGTALNMSAGAVRLAQHRALNRLRTHLAQRSGRQTGDLPASSTADRAATAGIPTAGLPATPTAAIRKHRYADARKQPDTAAARRATIDGSDESTRTHTEMPALRQLLIRPARKPAGLRPAPPAAAPPSPPPQKPRPTDHCPR